MFYMEGGWRLCRGMAIYRCEARIISREKRGHSVVAASAYRAGLKLKDELSGKMHDYSRRSKGVVETAIVGPDNAPGWVHDPGQLWNKVEAGEKRKDAQLAREFILAVPKELSPQAQFSLHHSKTGKNPHVHVLCTMRKLDGENFSAKKPREWNDVKLLLHQRESWADAVNAALEKAGRPERVDHRSLKDRGIDQLPQPKIGKEATAMKRKGILQDPERFKAVREVKMLNEVRGMMKAILNHGEVRQIGMGDTWWEKSITFMSRIREQAATVVKHSWRKLVRRPKDGPEIEM